MRSKTTHILAERFKQIAFLALIVFACQLQSSAQGDGPRAFLLAPKGVWGINPKWMNLNQNFLPSGSILVKNADIKVDVFPTSLFHTFGIGGRYAQLIFMVNPGSASGTVEPGQPGIPAPQLNASGFGDGCIGFKIGLNDAPALDLKQFASHPMQPSMSFYFRLWYSGTYDANKPLNLGTNRTSYEFGLPMAIPFGTNPKRATWLEMYPSIRIYTANNDPTVITQAEKSQQLPLFLLENHLTHNFTSKLWAGLDLRYQYGGALELDGVNQDNIVNILGGGVEAGYQLLPFLSASAGYGTILAGDNDARSDMFRLSIVFVYANTKKL